LGEKGNNIETTSWKIKISAYIIVDVLSELSGPLSYFVNLTICKEESQRIDIKRFEMEDHGDISPQWRLIFLIF
jgi:hypothetical protein